MRHTHVVVVLTCLLWPGAVLGQQPERFAASSRAAIEQLFVIEEGSGDAFPRRMRFF